MSCVVRVTGKLFLLIPFVAMFLFLRFQENVEQKGLTKMCLNQVMRSCTNVKTFQVRAQFCLGHSSPKIVCALKQSLRGISLVIVWRLPSTESVLWIFNVLLKIEYSGRNQELLKMFKVSPANFARAFH